ncbi:MAG: DegT/DnrJ/EryC1/StrS family aminotransferase, partial [Candidatus Staskawiczbacteria bacterium]|nr:DegT/DnrJ/EryC1/StrS family aminotransferase [Candidatus Staskawiczbacteria bacterium]
TFFGNKNITTGEGGMCLTNKKKIAEKMRILRNQGVNPNKKYWHNVIGFNYRMTNIQSAIGTAQLKKIDQFIKSKRKILEWYKKGLKKFVEEGIISFQEEMPWAKCVYWMTSILVEDKFSTKKISLMKYLERKGIETRPLFYPVDSMPPYKKKDRENFPIANDLSRKGLSLPSSVKLNRKEVKLICMEIENFIKKSNEK